MPNPTSPPTDRHTYTVPDDPKILRETLCAMQAYVLTDPRTSLQAVRETMGYYDMLQRLIDECDRKKRPSVTDKKWVRPDLPCPPPEQLVRDLAAVLNRHSMENRSNTPDFMLAEYLVRCLDAFDTIVNNRGEWYGPNAR